MSIYKPVDQQDGVRVGTVEQRNILDGQPMILVQMPGSMYEVYNRSCARCLSYMMLILGSLSICGQIGVVVVSASWTKDICPGFWAGAIFIICGTLGLISVSTLRKKHVVAFLVFCIFALISASAMIALGIYGIFKDQELDKEGHVRNYNERFGLNIALIVLAALELLFAFIATIVACVASCKRTTQMATITM